MEGNQNHPQTSNLDFNCGFVEDTISVSPNAQSAPSMQGTAPDVNSTPVQQHSQIIVRRQLHSQAQVATTSPAPPKTPLNMKQAECDWTQEHYACFADWLLTGISGEEIMQRCGISRRKELLARVQILSQNEQKFYNVKWEDQSFLEKGKRALPALKIGSEGDLRISKERLTRMGVAFSPGALLKLEKHSPNVFAVKLMP